MLLSYIVVVKMQIAKLNAVVVGAAKMPIFRAPKATNSYCTMNWAYDYVPAAFYNELKI